MSHPRYPVGQDRRWRAILGLGTVISQRRGISGNIRADQVNKGLKAIRLMERRRT
jgi:hypothetical protein